MIIWVVNLDCQVSIKYENRYEKLRMRSEVQNEI